MRGGSRISVTIPARNEERSIGLVLAAIPRWVDEIVVCDNGSTDHTAQVAAEQGARVVAEARRGYGAACQAALVAIQSADVVVFLDADFSDDPSEMASLVDPILRNEADLVIGSRVRGKRQSGALTPQARLGNWLACRLIRLIWGASFTDLGPFRAIRFPSLKQLHMRDRDYGWTAEMQVKALAHGLRVLEVPVNYRVRIGESKVSGTLRGVIGAGTKIIYTIVRSALWRAYGKPSSKRRHLIVFTRYPEAGAVKTRLIPALGAKGAAELSRKLTRDTIRWATRLQHEEDVSVEIRYTGGTADLMHRAFGNSLVLSEQGNGDLGDRLARATREAFSNGAQHVVLVGTDCPALNENVVLEAFEHLERSDLVVGPAEDGGYYLLGLTTPHTQFFQGITWGSGTVLRDTLARANHLELSVKRLNTLRDVDRPEDLAVGNSPEGLC